MPPTHFPLEAIIIRSYPWWQEGSSIALESIHKIYVLSTHHLIARGSKKSKGEGQDIQVSQKEKLF